MLAYVFWHRPSPEAAEYEAAVAAFHAALADQPSEGLRGSACFRVKQPWCDGYEDWYVVDDWAALGVLNSHAPTLAAHAGPASMAVWGSGAVYRLVAGESALDAPDARWEDKPPGVPYENFHAKLPQKSIWQRQLVLGPAPEYCLPGAGGGERRRVGGGGRRPSTFSA